MVTRDASTDFKNAVEWYKAHKAEVVQKYEGKYVAIINGQVIDSDIDRSELSVRMYKRIGNKDIYMPYVRSGPEIVHRMPGPRRPSNPTKSLSSIMPE